MPASESEIAVREEVNHSDILSETGDWEHTFQEYSACRDKAMLSELARVGRAGDSLDIDADVEP